MFTHCEFLCPNIVTYLPFYYNRLVQCQLDPIPVFKMREEFSDEEKNQWRKFLHRADSSSLKHIYFCAKHFQPWEVLYTCEVVLLEDWIHIVSFEFV